MRARMKRVQRGFLRSNYGPQHARSRRRAGFLVCHGSLARFLAAASILNQEGHLQSRSQPRCIPAYAICIHAMIPYEIRTAALQGDNEVVMQWLRAHPEGINDVAASGSSLLQLCAEDREFTVEQLELSGLLLLK